MRVSIIKSMFAIITLILIFVGCNSRNLSDYQSRTSTVKTKGNPVKICVMQDKSGSTKWNRVPQIAPADIDSLLEIVLRRGGEIGFGLINDDSNRPLVRVRVEEPPVEPALPEPSAERNVFLAAQAAARRKKEYERKLEQYEEDVQRWHEDTNKAVKRFEAELQPLLELKPQARRTDISGALLRAKLFLGEPNCGWSTPPALYAILLSDGADTVGKAIQPLQSPARLILVNSSGKLGVLKSLSPVCFENPSAAIRWIGEEVSK